jgi:hypothetical protein
LNYEIFFIRSKVNQACVTTFHLSVSLFSFLYTYTW